MSDGENIDDILKSIDALLREEGEHQGEKAVETAAEAEDGTPSEAAVPPENDDAGAADAENAAISILPDAGEEDAADARSVQHDSQHEPLQARADDESELTAEGGNEATPDEPALPVEAKRIVLSAEMVVTEAAEAEDANLADSESGQDSDTESGKVLLNAGQIARITDEVCEALQAQLPGIVAPLVARALHRHFSGRTDEQDERSES